jgi:hypothetical protein
MNWKNIGIAAVAYALISTVVHAAGAIADMGYYANPVYSAVWSSIMMPGPAPPPAGFYLLSVCASLAMGAIFAYGYSLVCRAFVSNRAFRAEPPWKTGAKYGIFAFALSGLTTLTLPLILNVPSGIALSWTVQSLLAFLLAGAAAGAIFDKK